MSLLQLVSFEKGNKSVNIDLQLCSFSYTFRIIWNCTQHSTEQVPHKRFLKTSACRVVLKFMDPQNRPWLWLLATVNPNGWITDFLNYKFVLQYFTTHMNLQKQPSVSGFPSSASLHDNPIYHTVMAGCYAGKRRWHSAGDSGTGLSWICQFWKHSWLYGPTAFLSPRFMSPLPQSAYRTLLEVQSSFQTRNHCLKRKIDDLGNTNVFTKSY